jgi:cytoskeletal protein CcmA (bactofilin family)
MRTISKIVTVLFLATLLLIPATPVAAKGNWDGKVIFGDTFTLKSGESLNGDLVVMGGVVMIENGATVNGSVVLIGGTLTIEGEVTADAVLVGGTATLSKSAHIHGNLVTIGGNIQGRDEARIDGEVISNLPAPEITIPAPSAPESPARPPQPIRQKAVSNLFLTIGRIVVVSLLALLAMLFLEPQTQRVAHAITRQPLIAGATGLLIIALLPLAVILLSITIVLIPVALLIVLAVILAWLLGVIALGLEVGIRLTNAIHRQWPIALTAGFGTFLLMTALELLNLIPCVGWLASLLVGLAAIGSAALTVFGSRPYPPAAPAETVLFPPSDGPAG